MATTTWQSRQDTSHLRWHRFSGAVKVIDYIEDPVLIRRIPDYMKQKSIQTSSASCMRVEHRQ
jgi:hypothetical protein